MALHGLLLPLLPRQALALLLIRTGHDHSPPHPKKKKMVIISAAICSRGGKGILARQFVEMPRTRVEALLSAFPKLVSPTKQHTFVENESVRYLFQPLESLFLVLITTKSSNVVEDVDTLRLLAKIVTEACPAPTEDAIIEAAFDLVAAFDEVISLGYREFITLQGVRTNLEMNSHEEKLSNMIRESKEIEAKQQAKLKEKMLAQKAEPGMGPGGRPMGGGSGMQGFGPGSGGYTPPPPSAAAAPKPGAAGAANTAAAAAAKPAAPKKGIQLSKKSKDQDVLKTMAAEDGIDEDALMESSGAAAPTLAVPGAVAVPKDPVTVTIAETVSCTLLADGSLSLYEVQGQVSIVCRAEDMRCQVQLERAEELADKFTFTTHPQLDKAAFASSRLIALKQKDRPLPANTAFGALKYRSKPVSDVSEIPLSVTVWPEAAGAGKGTNVNVEFQLQAEWLELFNVTFVIPLNSAAEPQVVSAEAGVHRYNSRRQQLEWTIDIVSGSTNTTGSLEFNLPPAGGAGGKGGGASGTDGFFPTTVSFSSNKSLAGLGVAKVMVEGQPDTRFGVEFDVKADAYQVVMEE